MPLQHLIIHGVSRPQSTGQTQLQLRNEEIELNGVMEELFHDVKQSMLKRSSKDYGRFSDHTADHPCSAYLKEHQTGKLGFVSLSKKIAQQFQLEMDKMEVAFEGYLLVAHETLEDGDHYQFSILEHDRGLYLNSALEIEESFHLDIEACRLSARVCVNDWLSEDVHRNGNAVTLTLWRGERELSEIFKLAVGFADKVDIAAETEQFIEVINEFTKDVSDETAYTVRKKVVDYCEQQKQINKPVAIEKLSAEIHDTVSRATKSQDPIPNLQAYVTQQRSKVAAEFIPDTKQIKNLVRIAGRNDLLSMSFASSCLGETVIYDPSSDTLTITNIPNALKSRLKKYVK